MLPGAQKFPGHLLRNGPWNGPRLSCRAVYLQRPLVYCSLGVERVRSVLGALGIGTSPVRSIAGPRGFAVARTRPRVEIAPPTLPDPVVIGRVCPTPSGYSRIPAFTRLVTTVEFSPDSLRWGDVPTRNGHLVYPAR